MSAAQVSLQSLAAACRAVGLEPHVTDTKVTADAGTFTVSLFADEMIRGQATWNAELSKKDYLAALSIANNLNAAHPWPRVEISDAEHSVSGVLSADHPLRAHAHVVHPSPANDAQLESLVRNAFAAGVGLAAAFGTAFPAVGGPNETATVPALEPAPQIIEGVCPPVTGQRIEEWFAARGVTDVPFDFEHSRLNFSFDGTPVDFVVSDSEVFHVEITAPVPGNREPDPALLVDLCNRANGQQGGASSLSGLTTSCVQQEAGAWWVTSKSVVPVSTGLDEGQFDYAMRAGVVGAASQLKAILGNLQ